MNRERMRTIMKVVERAGLVVVRLAENLWMIPVPTTVETVHTVNADGFNPHEVREVITAARCVILGHGVHKPPSLTWKAAGAIYYDVHSDADVIAALAEFGFDIVKAM